MAADLDLDTFKAWWRTDLSVDDPLIVTAIAAAKSALSTSAGRAIRPVADTPTTRFYRPKGRGRLLLIADAHEIVSVTENGSTLSGSNWQAEAGPDELNQVGLDGEYRPWSILRRLTSTWYCDGERATVGIEARWGWATLPELALEAWKVITADVLANRDVRHGLVAVTDAAAISARTNPVALKAAHAYAGHGAVALA